MISGMFKLFLGVVAIVFIGTFLFASNFIDLDNLNPGNFMNAMDNLLSSKQNPDIRGDIVSGSIKARNIEGDINGGKGIEAEKITGDINGGEDITAEELYGDIINGSNIDLDAMIGDIEGGEDIEVNTLVGDVKAGKNIHIRTLIGEDKTKDNENNVITSTTNTITNSTTNTITIDRIIEKETIIKEIC